jgi:hypothetical protein
VPCRRIPGERPCLARAGACRLQARLTNLTLSSLDGRGARYEIRGHMASFRPIITALIVCALAVLPAASASAAMRMAGTMGSMAAVEKGSAESSSMHSGCADHANMAVAEDMAVAKQHMAIAKKDTASTPSADDRGACPVSGCSKCLCLGLAVTGVISTGPAAPSLSYSAILMGWATPSLLAPSILPPSPPPRV